MAITVELEAAAEEGSYIVTATITDEDDAPVTPNSLTWTLTDAKGNVINGRSQIVVAIPSDTVEIFLFGDDLARPATAPDKWRYLLLEGTYDSPLKSNAPLKGQAKFPIEDFVAVT